MPLIGLETRTVFRFQIQKRKIELEYLHANGRCLSVPECWSCVWKPTKAFGQCRRVFNVSIVAIISLANFAMQVNIYKEPDFPARRILKSLYTIDEQSDNEK